MYENVNAVLLDTIAINPQKIKLTLKSNKARLWMESRKIKLLICNVSTFVNRHLWGWNMQSINKKPIRTLSMLSQDIFSWVYHNLSKMNQRRDNERTKLIVEHRGKSLGWRGYVGEVFRTNCFEAIEKSNIPTDHKRLSHHKIKLKRLRKFCTLTIRTKHKSFIRPDRGPDKTSTTAFTTEFKRHTDLKTETE